MNALVLATFATTSAALYSPNATADWALGIGAQYGGFLGVEYAWRYENHVASLGVGSLILGVGTSLNLKWLLGENDHSSVGLSFHPVFSWSGFDGELETHVDPLMSVSWNWHPHAYRSHGMELGFGALIFPSGNIDDDSVVPSLSVGYRF